MSQDLPDVFDQPVDNKEITIYDNTWKSVMFSFRQCIREMVALGITPEIQIVNVDSHATIFDLPECDCIMLESFNSYVDSKKLGFGWFIGVSTFNDTNNHRLAKIISFMYSRYCPGRSMAVLNDSLQEVAKLNITDGTEVMPMNSEKSRSVQFITVQALSTATVL